MPAANIVKAWRQGEQAHMAVSVTETQLINGVATPVNVEYVGSVVASELEGKTAAQQKALLVAAAKAQRDSTLAGTAAAALAITGSVTI